MTPQVAPTVGLDHLHAPAVSVREQAALVVDRLRRERTCSFRTLVADADSTLVIVARFLALLELFREAAIAFDQAEALGELTVRWTGEDEGEIDVGDEFDEADERDEDDDRPRATGTDERHEPDPERPVSRRCPTSDVARRERTSGRGRPSAAEGSARGADRLRHQRLPGRRPRRHRGGAHGRRRAGDRDVARLGARAARRGRRRPPARARGGVRRGHRGFTLRSVAGGWRVYSRSEYAPVVEKFLLDGQQAKLTQASLETLAVIAYRQPVSRLARQRGPRGQRRRRRPHAAHPRPHRGGRRRGRERRDPLRHDAVLPPAAGARQPRRAAGPRALPARG